MTGAFGRPFFVLANIQHASQFQSTADWSKINDAPPRHQGTKESEEKQIPALDFFGVLLPASTRSAFAISELGGLKQDQRHTTKTPRHQGKREKTNSGPGFFWCLCALVVHVSGFLSVLSAFSGNFN